MGVLSRFKEFILTRSESFNYYKNNYETTLSLYENEKNNNEMLKKALDDKEKENKQLTILFSDMNNEISDLRKINDELFHSMILITDKLENNSKVMKNVNSYVEDINIHLMEKSILLENISQENKVFHKKIEDKWDKTLENNSKLKQNPEITNENSSNEEEVINILNEIKRLIDRESSLNKQQFEIANKNIYLNKLSIEKHNDILTQYYLKKK